MKYLNNNCISLPSELYNLDESALRNCSNLETFKIRSSGDSNNLKDTWKSLIENQSKLVTFEISSSYLVSKTMWAKVYANNFKTLTTFDFRAVGMENESLRYDLSVFTKCFNLKYLELNLMGASMGEFFCNFETLPDHIEKLRVNCFMISSVEFLKFLKSHYSLLNLEIEGVGEEYEFGVNSSVMKEILIHESLKNVKMGVGYITQSISQSERRKFKNMFSELVNTNDWNEFDAFTLNKSSDSNTWVVKYRYDLISHLALV